MLAPVVTSGGRVLAEPFDEVATMLASSSGEVWASAGGDCGPVEDTAAVARERLKGWGAVQGRWTLGQDFVIILHASALGDICRKAATYSFRRSKYPSGNTNTARVFVFLGHELKDRGTGEDRGC